jgi:predicted nucleic acid-binding protein
MALLIDSNIIIYSFSTEYAYLRGLIIDESSVISEITRIEVLGYHGLQKDQESYFQDIFSYTPIIVPDQKVFDKAIDVRKKYNLKLGDSIIAATALVHGLKLYTRNLKDFERIATLKCVNPIP